MWICLFFFFFFANLIFTKTKILWYQIKKWMICLRFSYDSNFIFLTNVLCLTSLYRYQIYLTLKWPPRSLRYGRHIIAWYSLIFFFVLRSAVFTTLEQFLLFFKITLKEPISRKGFFSLVHLITLSLEKEGCFFGEILFIGQNAVIKCVDSCKTRYDNYRITIGLHPTRRNFFLKPTRTLAKSENICIVFIWHI